MFHPTEMPLERGWVGRIEGDEVVHLASQTLQHLFTGGGSARDHARYALADVELLVPLPSPPSVRVFDEGGSFEFANPASVVGPGARVTRPRGSGLAVDAGLAGLVGLETVVAVAPVARLRAPALAPPKDRDFAIVLGPWFTTTDEGVDASAVRITGDGVDHEGTAAGFDWEAARRFAAENTRLRVGDLLLAPAAAVVDLPAGTGISVDMGRLGTLPFVVDAP
jgi:hypothetical protein